MSPPNMPTSRIRFAPAVRGVLNLAVGTCRGAIPLVVLAGQGWRRSSVFHRDTQLTGGPLTHDGIPTLRLWRMLPVWTGFAMFAIALGTAVCLIVLLGLGILILLQKYVGRDHRDCGGSRRHGDRRHFRCCAFRFLDAHSRFHDQWIRRHPLT